MDKNKYNFFDKVTVDKENEIFLKIFENNNIKIEKIVSNGQTSPKNFWYEQKENEFVMVLDGFAILQFEEKEVELAKGDSINIPAFVKHRVKYTSKKESTIWLAVFY